jgi:hypothetical protein
VQQLKDPILLEKETKLDRAIWREQDVIFDPARQTRPHERLKSEARAAESCHVQTPQASLRVAFYSKALSDLIKSFQSSVSPLYPILPFTASAPHPPQPPVDAPLYTCAAGGT